MTKFPWHFWPIVVVAVLWHGIGAFNYTMTQIEWAPWMQLMTERQEVFADRMPAWVDAAWASMVWFGLIGALLLAGGASIAPLALFVSAVAAIALTIWFQLFSVPTLLGLGGPVAQAVLIGTCVFAVLLWLYARSLRSRRLI